VLEGVDAEVRTLVARTQEKIQNLVNEVKADEEAEKAAAEGRAAKPAKPRLSRKKLFEVLAEIAQELCQPLSVINCAIGMLKAGSLGAVTEQQVNMLDLAGESGEKLQVLIDNLMEISGMPETRSPDGEIQSALYDR
jgi:signal transduction histidine kinase